MEIQEDPGMAGKEELVSSWQDLRGRHLLTGEHKWETIAGGRHADVVALDGGVEAFAGLSCVKTNDDHVGDYLTGVGEEFVFFLSLSNICSCVVKVSRYHCMITLSMGCEDMRGSRISSGFPLL